MSDYQGDGFSSRASDAVKKLVMSEDRRRKSQKRNLEMKEERKERVRERRVKQEEEDNSYLLKYRDRAKELRELGYDKDYEGLLPEDFANLTEEELQLLGGDASRSHLVKGLDMVLLEKRRKEIAEAEEKKRIAQERMNEMKLNIRSFTTPMAMNIYSTLFEREVQLQDVNLLTDVREANIKGKTNYSLVVDGESSTDDFGEGNMFSVPTVTVRSKHDCPDFSLSMLYQPSDELLGEITKSMANVGNAQTKKTRKRKNRLEIKAVDPDLDMFAD